MNTVRKIIGKLTDWIAQLLFRVVTWLLATTLVAVAGLVELALLMSPATIIIIVVILALAR